MSNRAKDFSEFNFGRCDSCCHRIALPLGRCNLDSLLPEKRIAIFRVSGGDLVRVDHMSLCRLCSIQALDLRPVRLRCIILPRGGYRVQCVAEAGGRSYATRRRTNRSSRSEDDDDDGRAEDGEKVRGGRGYWDSNAEGVRRSRGRQQGWNRVDDTRNPGSEPAPGWSMPKKEWDYDSEEKEKRSNESTSQQRWQSSDYDDEYEYDEEEEEEEDEDDSDFDLRSLLQDQLFPSLRWGLPISLIVLPWLLGNPMMLILGVTAIPPVQKVVGPIVNEIWQTLLDFSGYSSPRQRRRGRSGYNTQSDSDEYTEPYSGWGVGSNEPQPYSSRSDNLNTSTSTDIPYQPMKPSDDRFSEEVQTPIPAVRRSSQPRRNPGRAVKMGGWEDLEADRRRRMPVRKEKRPWNLGRRRSSRRREEQPLLLKLILAVFPFLRTWGGWLSVLLLFPSLSVLETVNDTLSIS